MQNNLPAYSRGLRRQSVSVGLLTLRVVCLASSCVHVGFFFFSGVLRYCGHLHALLVVVFLSTAILLGRIATWASSQLVHVHQLCAFWPAGAYWSLLHRAGVVCAGLLHQQSGSACCIPGYGMTAHNASVHCVLCSCCTKEF